MLFVEPEPVEAVLAVLEMVLDMVCGCQVNVLPKHWNSAPEGSVALPATTLRVVYATVWDEAAPSGVFASCRHTLRSAGVARGSLHTAR